MCIGGQPRHDKKERCGVAAKQKKRGKTEYEDWPWAVIIGKQKQPIFQVTNINNIIKVP